MHILYVGVAGFSVALYFALQGSFGQNLDLTLLAAAMLSSLIVAVFCKRNLWRNILLVGFFVLLGLLNGLRVGPSAAEQLQPYFGKEVVLTGRLEPLSSKEQQTYTSCILQCEVLQQGKQTIVYNGRVRLTLPQRIDGTVIVQGRLEELQALRNPGCFDSELYNRINNIGGRLTKAKVIETSVTHKASSFWHQAQEKLAHMNLIIRKAFDAKIGKSLGALLGSMLFGGSSSLDEATKDIFTANGLSHLLSVSGTHLVLLAGLLAALLSPLPQSWRRIMMTLCLGMYALICGLKPPVLRALLMSLVLLWGKGENKGCNASRQPYKAERGYLLCLVALILLLFKPLWLLDLGFQLSFGAAAGLVCLLPACQRLVPDALPDFIAEALSVTMAAQLATLPILVANFHQVSLIAFVSNLILVPVLEFAVLISILGIALASIPLAMLGVMGEKLLYTASLCLEALLLQGKILASLPYSQLIIGSLPLWCAFSYYVLILVWADVPALQLWSNIERRWLMTGIASLLVGMLCWQRLAPQPLQAYFLDVGQGDCVIITTKNKTIVYDTGGLPNYDTGKNIVAPFLRSLGRGSVDALILSHYDFDHVGGAVGLMEKLQVQELVLPKEALDVSSLPLYEVITQTAFSRGTKISIAEQGRSWQLGTNAILSIVVPADLANNSQIAMQTETAPISSDNEMPLGNDASTIVALQSPNGSLLLTGDLGSDKENELEWGNFTVFKAAHHGSRNSNSEEFLQKIRPEMTIISCGKNNRYGHPHQETLERLEQVGSKIYRTDAQGYLRLVFDESGIKCYSYM